MGRLLITGLVALALPAGLYILWRTFAPRWGGGSRAISHGQWETMPWPWLAVAGVLLLGVTLGWMATVGGGGPESTYQAPRMIDGKIEPGRFLPPADR